jgi:hypothetical protein
VKFEESFIVEHHLEHTGFKGKVAGNPRLNTEQRKPNTAYLWTWDKLSSYKIDGHLEAGEALRKMACIDQYQSNLCPFFKADNLAYIMPYLIQGG